MRKPWDPRSRRIRYMGIPGIHKRGIFKWGNIRILNLDLFMRVPLGVIIWISKQFFRGWDFYVVADTFSTAPPITSPLWHPAVHWPISTHKNGSWYYNANPLWENTCAMAAYKWCGIVPLPLSLTLLPNYGERGERGEGERWWWILCGWHEKALWSPRLSGQH